ncbi:MAG TPA: type II toxin-antitoxin system VapC family toxin [Opitutaceae bacterium]|nr:type II toxin-antitoxin system VapC family toxin [Opitutaceae bacterium]
MKLLLDTHVVDWAQSDPSRLSEKVRDLIGGSKPGDLAVSDASLTELAQHLKSGRIRTTDSPEVWLNAAIEGFVVLPATIEIALLSAFLEWEHRDPCDRQIVATAVRHNLTLLTIDERIRGLRTPGLKAVW